MATLPGQPSSAFRSRILRMERRSPSGRLTTMFGYYSERPGTGRDLIAIKVGGDMNCVRFILFICAYMVMRENLAAAYLLSGNWGKYV